MRTKNKSSRMWWMDFTISESSYPITFRQSDSQKLGDYLKQRQSVEIIGMKRVGISNFLRFFLYHPKTLSTYVEAKEKHFFIPIDLNDLVERELYPFWMLLYKRIVDQVEKTELKKKNKQRIAATFLIAIQSHNLFLLIDGIREALSFLVEENFLPTIFLLRFDRMKQAVTPEFFDNLQGLIDATHQKLAFVFTSYRSLDILCSEVVSKASLALFSQQIYLKPLKKEDMQIIYEKNQDKYKLPLSSDYQRELFNLTGGNVQYLQLALIFLHEKKDLNFNKTDDLASLLSLDERIVLQSEELWESLTVEEKELVLKIIREEDVSLSMKKKVPYVFDTGIILEEQKRIFSPLFMEYILSLTTATEKKKEIVFSKKEFLLFTTLQEHLGEIRERDAIIEAVWPEYVEFGVSDWSIDRLVARVRAKLRQQDSPYEIKTIRTRGYMLISKI